MKNALLRFAFLCGLCISVSTARAQYVTIPDASFGNLLYVTGYNSCMTSGGGVYRLDTTCTAVLTARTLYIYSTTITDLTGIRYFKRLDSLTFYGSTMTTLAPLPDSLEYLEVNSNMISSMPPLPSTLKFFDLDNNEMTALPTLPAGLEQLSCAFNHLSSLPSLPFTLQRVTCFYNNIATMPALPVSLKELNCGNNHLVTLPALPTGLRILGCGDSLFTTIPALPDSLRELDFNYCPVSVIPALPAHLTSLSCTNTNVAVIPALPSSLTTLTCFYTQITSLPALPASLRFLSCGNNALGSLPALPDSLTELYCGSDQLSVLPTLPSTLTTLNCSKNYNLSCLPRIYQPYLSYFFIDSTNIHCLPNVFTANTFDISPATLPVCTPGSGCDFYYNISGNAHTYTAASCAADSVSPGGPLRFVKIQLLQNNQVLQQCYTSQLGEYTFETDGLGAYDVSVDTATQMTPACPVTGLRSVVLSAADSLFSAQNFGLACTNTDYTVQSIEGRFRPGFSPTVHIAAGSITALQYGAHCGAGVPGTVTTTWSGPVYYQQPGPGGLTPVITAGNSLSYTLSDLSVLDTANLDIVMDVDSNALVGSQICFTTIISPTPADVYTADDTLTQCFTVVNSLDPNVKEVYPAYISQQGEWLTYTIHFQNTGTDTAYTVVVRDTLSSYVQAETFQYLASDHHAVIQLKGNAMTLSFPKISLVDSGTNEPLSHAWIQYKVKTKPNLPLQTQIKNTAYIYFDLNTAVVTNTAVTTMVQTGINDIAVNNVIQLYPNPNAGSFTLQTSNLRGEYVISDMLGNVIEQKAITTDKQLINLSNAAAGVYTLSLKGAQVVRFVVVR